VTNKETLNLETLNLEFSVEGISLLNLVIASSSSVQFKKYLYNQVDDIAGNEVSPTKQARGNRQGTKTPSVIECRKNLGRNQAQLGGIHPIKHYNNLILRS